MNKPDQDDPFLNDAAFCRAVLAVLVSRLPDKKTFVTQKELDDVTNLILAEGVRQGDFMLGVFTQENAPSMPINSAPMQ